jgi:hypothetical protein
MVLHVLAQAPDLDRAPGDPLRAVLDPLELPGIRREERVRSAVRLEQVGDHVRRQARPGSDLDHRIVARELPDNAFEQRVLPFAEQTRVRHPEPPEHGVRVRVDAAALPRIHASFMAIRRLSPTARA